MTAEMFGADEESGLIGMRFYRHPIFSVTRADNPGFLEIKKPEVVGGHHFLPHDWLPGAKTVISIFLPFEKATVEANKKTLVEPALEWVYTRVDGQQFLLALGALVKDELKKAGFDSVSPYTDERFVMNTNPTPEPDKGNCPPYSTNWSERHVGVVCGLGTFGMSTNFISKVGAAGRLVSVVTEWDIPADEADYDDWLGYCNKCGLCVKNCPADAFYTDRHGKNHETCSMYIRKACQKFAPRYGCGKCQSGLPCDYKPMKPA